MGILKCMLGRHKYTEYGFAEGTATVHVTNGGTHYCTYRDVPCKAVVEVCISCRRLKATSYASDGSTKEEEPYLVIQAKGFTRSE